MFIVFFSSCASHNQIISYNTNKKRRVEKNDNGESFYLPLVVRRSAPIYPISAMKAGIEGKVVVQFTIEKDGSVTGYKIIEGVPELNNAVLRAVKEFTFLPALNTKKEPIAVKWKMPITFKLKKKANK